MMRMGDFGGLNKRGTASFPYAFGITKIILSIGCKTFFPRRNDDQTRGVLFANSEGPHWPCKLNA